MPQKNRLRAEGGLAGRGRVRSHESATEFQGRNQSPELWRQDLHSSHHSQQRRRPAGTARQGCDMLWGEGNPPYSGCHFPLLEPGDHWAQPSPGPPRQTLLGQTPEEARRARTRISGASCSPTSVQNHHLTWMGGSRAHVGPGPGEVLAHCESQRRPTRLCCPPSHPLPKPPPSLSHTLPGTRSHRTETLRGSNHCLSS